MKTPQGNRKTFQTDPGTLSLAEQAYRQLEEMIVTLVLPPGGDPVRGDPERPSRGSAGPRSGRRSSAWSTRDWSPACRARGLIVRDMKVEDQFTLLEVLRPLDRLIAAKAAQWAMEPQREALRACAVAMAEAARARNLHAFLQCDQACDMIVYQAARNPLRHRHRHPPSNSHCRRFWCSFSRDGDLDQVAKLHIDLMKVVADGEAAKAELASDALISYLEGFTKAVLGIR